MRLRPLLLSLAILVPSAALVWWIQRPAPPPSDSDARLGQRLADPAVIAEAARVKITSAGQTLELARSGDAASPRWTIVGEPVLPADASRLTRLSADFVAAKIERLVSTKPERIAGYELDQSGIAFLDAAGAPLLDLDLGKTPDGGGRIVRFGDEAKAYLARLSASLDASAAAWRDTALVAGLKAEDIASLSIGFSDAPVPVVISRTAADQPWTSPSTPAGSQVKASALGSLPGNLSGLRYTQIAPKLDPGVVAARVFPREVVATTFKGRTVKFLFARAPELPAPPAPEVKEGEQPPAPPPAPPRPVYVEVVDSEPDSVLATASQTHAFEVGEWVFTSLPATTTDLFEPVPAPPAAPAAPETETAPAPKSEPITVTTEPLSIDSVTAPQN
jgi:hypothetical protein